MNYITDKFRASMDVERGNEAIYVYLNSKTLKRAKKAGTGWFHLTDVEEKVLEDQTYLTYTLGCRTPYTMLRGFKKRVAPADRARSIELGHKYNKLHKIAKNQNLDMWLQVMQQWEMTYMDGMKLGLPEVANERPQHDFILSVSALEPNFASY